MWFELNRIYDRTKDKLKISQRVCFRLYCISKTTFYLILLYNDFGTNSDANRFNFSLLDSFERKLLRQVQCIFLISSGIYCTLSSIYPLKLESLLKTSRR